MLYVLMIISSSSIAQNAVWQWHVDMPQSSNKKGEPQAYLWIPPSCKELKGLVLTQHNMEEISIVEDETFRRAMQDLDFGIIWYNPMFDVSFNFEGGAGDLLNQSLADLAAKSGYGEVETVPYLAIGHSAAASWPYYLAAWNPQKTICCISVSGQWPYVRNEWVAPDIWGDKTIDYIPCLETMGEYESANTWSTEGLKERQDYPLLPLSMLACPAEGHFATSKEKMEYLIFYIKKALQYRMPEGKIPLVEIDPTKTGWLADKWRINEKSHAESAPINDYKGDKTQAFWFFDEEHVHTTEAYQARFRNKLAPLLGVKVDGELVEQRNSHLQVMMPFKPKGDELLVTVEGVFLDTVPTESPRPASWTGFKAGTKLEKPADKESIYFEKICGPYEIKDSLFQVKLNRTSYKSLEERYESAFAIKYAGNERFKPAVQQGHFFIPATHEDGEGQTICFPRIRNIKQHKKVIQLKAKSSAKLPINYYVVSGPAEISGNKLYLTAVPPRTKFPIEVTVVAYQYGRLEVPKIQSATSITQTFYINK